MVNPQPLHDLLQERDRLWKTACPFVSPEGAAPFSIPDGVRAALADVFNPASPKEFSEETAHFARDLLESTPQGRRERLLVQINLLSKVLNSFREQIHRAPYGLVEAYFPVLVGGQVVHLLSTGPLKQGAWSAPEIATAQRVFGVPGPTLESAAKNLPVFAPAQIEGLFAATRRMASVLGAMLNAFSVSPAPAPAAGSGHSMDELNFGLAHHINNLLSVILGYSSAVQNRDQGLSPESRTAIHAVCEAAQKARRVTMEWLAFANHADEQVSLVHVHDGIRGVLSLLEPRNEGRVRFSMQFKATRDSVAALPSAVQRMLFNMLVTSVDSLSGAGGTIGIKTKNVKADADDPSDAREFLRIEVADSGGLATLPGVDPLVAELLAMDSREQEDQAGGLYALVRELDGTLMVSTDRNSVTKVEVLLPLCSEEEFKSPARRVRPRQTASRVWIADDDSAFADMCADILRGEGHEVRIFSDGVSLRAQWLHPEGRPDLLVYDHNLPEASGLEMREWMQEAGIATPLLLVSGLSPAQADIRAALAMRKTHFLQKPFTARELSDMASLAMGETLIGG